MRQKSGRDQSEGRGPKILQADGPKELAQFVTVFKPKLSSFKGLTFNEKYRLFPSAERKLTG